MQVNRIINHRNINLIKKSVEAIGDWEIIEGVSSSTSDELNEEMRIYDANMMQF